MENKKDFTPSKEEACIRNFRVTGVKLNEDGTVKYIKTRYPYGTKNGDVVCLTTYVMNDKSEDKFAPLGITEKNIEDTFKNVIFTVTGFALPDIKQEANNKVAFLSRFGKIIQLVK